MITPLSSSVTAVVEIRALSPQWRERFLTFLKQYRISHCIDGDTVTFGTSYIWGFKNLTYLMNFTQGAVTVVEENSGARATWVCTAAGIGRMQIGLSIWFGVMAIMMLIVLPSFASVPFIIVLVLMLYGQALFWQWMARDYLRSLTHSLFCELSSIPSAT